MDGGGDRLVRAGDLVGVAEIAARLGVHRKTVPLWRRRHADFPPPLAELQMGHLWSWPDVEGWARATGRIWPPQRHV